MVTVCAGCNKAGQKIRLTYDEFIDLERIYNAALETNDYQNLTAKLAQYGWKIRTIQQLKDTALQLLGREKS